jgi:hypothetical protein
VSTSVYLLCEKALNLLHASSLRDISEVQKAMLEAYKYQELVEDHAQEEAISCMLFFESVRNGLLNTYPWVFARKTKKLDSSKDAAVSPPIAGWKFAYNLPDDCMRLLGVLQAHKTVKEHEQIEKTIECDVDPAIIRYTGLVEDVKKWPMLYQDAFCARLASAIESTVRGGVADGVQNYLFQLFQFAITEGYRTGIISTGFIADNYLQDLTHNTQTLFGPVGRERQAYGRPDSPQQGYPAQ